MPRKFLARLQGYLQGGELRARALRGGAWLGAGTVAAQLFRLGRNVLLTRLLAPESFGIMAIVISISSLLDTFTEIGIREAVIQNPKGEDENFLNAAWWLSAGRAVFSYAIVYLASPYIAHFYHSPELTGLARIALLGIVFRGVMSPRAFVSLKLMNFKRWALLQYGSSIAGTLLTVVLTLIMRSIWALAIGFAAEYLFVCLGSYLLFPFFPAFSMGKGALSELLRFSRGVFGLSFLNLIYIRSDVFVLGKVITAEQLGIYVMAIYLAQAPATFLLNYQGQILMPLFSHIQEDSGRTNCILGKGMSIIAAFLIPATTFILLSGRAALSVIYGPQYATAFWPLVLAVLIGFLNIANAQITTVFYATGQPGLHRTCLLVMALLMVIFIYPAVRYSGTIGAQTLVLIAMVAGYAIQLWQVRKLTGFHISGQNRNFAWMLMGPLSVLGAALFIREFIQAQLTPAQNLIFGGCAAMLALIAVILISSRRGKSFGVATT